MQARDFFIRLGTLAVVLLIVFGSPGRAQPAAKTVFQDCSHCPQMVMLPARRGGAPLAFSRFAISFDDWNACVADQACRSEIDDHGWGKGKRPVINITWSDATDYVRWLSATSGADYALPTSSQWEYAARGGTTTAFWWGEQAGTGHANCHGCGSPWQGTAPAGSFPANPFGLHEMTGNIWTWTTDCVAPRPSAKGPSCRKRVIRGGSWYYGADMARSSVVMTSDPRQWSYNIGLRVVRRFTGSTVTPHDDQEKSPPGIK
ncbi:MAG TPA: SUMF1/EgtB/PvdO family nonheme iron enzyme [Telmatospirillum sp.]|nr:SUMF1/EgtB/PvdO family nonheme iron enzyme [Telmatospirillum sp.]